MLITGAGAAGESVPRRSVQEAGYGSVRFDYAGCLECGTCRILGWGRRWNSGNTRAAPLVWSLLRLMLV